MTLSAHIAHAAKNAMFPAQRIIDLVELLRLQGAADQSVADAAMLRLLEMRRAI